MTGPARPASRAARTAPTVRNGAGAFRHRNYRLFFAGQLVSLVGSWMQQVAQSWLVLELTHDPLALGLVTALSFLPVLVLGLFGGVIADALPKRQTLIATQVVQMLLAFALFGLVVTGAVEVWHILVLAALLGVTNAVDMPTRQAFTVEMVGREDVANAVALNSAIFNGARIIGPAVAGLTIGAFGGDVSVAFLVNGFSFLAVIVAYWAMRGTDLQGPPSLIRPRSLGEVRTTIADGLRYVRGADLVLLVTLTVGLSSTFGMNFGVTIPALAQQVLRTDATGFGFLMTATGVGSLAAALGMAFAGRARPVAVPLGAIVLGIGLVASAATGAYLATLVALVPVGFGAIWMAATANTTIQLTVPDELRGRVISVYTTVFVGSTPVGGITMGWVASTFGVPAAMVLGGLGCVATGLVALAWMRRIRGRDLAMPLVPAAWPVPPGGAGRQAVRAR